MVPAEREGTPVAGHGRGRKWWGAGRTGTAAATAVVGCLAALAASGPVAAAAVTRSRPYGTTARVVEVVTRGTFGKMLAAHKTGLSLYIHSGGPCTGSCLSVWPALELPKAATTPVGAKCLATVALGRRKQVTYMGQRLYTYVGDSGTSVNGNGVGGFAVAKVAPSCP